MGDRRNYMISGHNVNFPYQPYPSQFAMMEKVIRALKTKENALLESATGTGKSLALLCASLSWQAGEKDRLRQETFVDSKPKPNFQARYSGQMNEGENNNNNTFANNNSNNNTNNNNFTHAPISPTQNSNLSASVTQTSTLTSTQPSSLTNTNDDQQSLQTSFNSTDGNSIPQTTNNSQHNSQNNNNNNNNTNNNNSQNNNSQMIEFKNSEDTLEKYDNTQIMEEFDKFQTLFQEDEAPVSNPSTSPTLSSSRTKKRFFQETNEHPPSSSSSTFSLSQATDSQPSQSSQTSQISQISQSLLSPPSQTSLSSQNYQPSSQPTITTTTTTTTSQMTSPLIEPITSQPISNTPNKKTNQNAATITILNDDDDDKENKQTNNNDNKPKQKKTKKPIIIEYDDDDDFMPTPKFIKPSITPAKRKPNNKNTEQPKTPRGNKPKKTPPSTPPSPSLSSSLSSSSSSSSSVSKKTPPNENSSHIKVPVIYFGTRTHTQVAQLVSELERTAPIMSVLAARDHYCIHPMVSRTANKNTECKKLLKLESCIFEKGTGKVAKHYSLVDRVWDVEDLVKLGHSVRGCPYFAARTIGKRAEIVFCPYNYIIDPNIREAMGIELEGAAVIFDEAHNIEDALMGVASVDFDLEDLTELLRELTVLSKAPVFHQAYEPIRKVVEGIVDWMHEAIVGLKPTDFETHTNFWSGDDLVDILSMAGVTQENMDNIGESMEAIVLLSESGESRVTLTNKAMTILLDLVKVLRFLYSEELRFSNDFRVVIQKVSRHTQGRSFWTHSLGVPRVAYRGLIPARSVILTSGTLSPMDSYASELGAKFELRAELGHVIDMNRQVWVGAVAKGPRGQSINTTFQFADSFAVQDAIGETIVSFLKSIPGGVLCFFPSYSLVDRLMTRWQTTGLWQFMQQTKSIFSEPKGSGADFTPVLNQFYNAANSSRGAALLAVCRGKVSEGIDFTDHYARGVIVVGIPYPSTKDLRVVLKRNYNDQHAIENGLIDGRSWYQLQAFRALNQALGRCIRHRHDYGCILLLDDRFMDKNVQGKLSKWVRGSVKMGGSVDNYINDLNSFFGHIRLNPLNRR